MVTLTNESVSAIVQGIAQDIDNISLHAIEDVINGVPMDAIQAGIDAALSVITALI
jgi:hypothetical protein